MASDGEVRAIHKQKSCDFKVRFATCVHQGRASNLVQLGTYYGLARVDVYIVRHPSIAYRIDIRFALLDQDGYYIKIA
jgi:hypothetical protein